ncbi:MAG: ATP-binding protein [Desulfobacterales bacterium]|jgi:CheY-like chemotaxis protein
MAVGFDASTGDACLSVQSPEGNRIDLPGDLLPLTGSRIHLFKTLLNLVANGFEAIPAEGSIEIVTANHYIDRPLKGYDDITEGDYVLFQVRDTGTGIAAGEMDRIFEPFYTTKAVGKAGSGLRMAVVWGTVKDHGGCIPVESQLNQGSAFSINVKALRDRMSSSQTSFPLEALKGKGESILVVDDIPCSETSPPRCSSIWEAIDWSSARAVDLVVLDMIMEPGMDRLDTCRRILERRPTQRAIIASGFSETHRVKETIKLGAGAYIQKPYTIEKLAIAIREGLGSSER